METSRRSFGTEDAIAFLEGRGVDGSGRTVYDYFKFTVEEWEACHNHIQWAFPSHIASEFNPDAQGIDMKEFSETINADGILNILKLVIDYLRSLGFELDEEGNLRFNPDSERVDVWLTPFNHNYRRITRMLNLLSWIAPDLSIDLLREFIKIGEDAMERYYHYYAFGEEHKVPCMNHETMVYWTKAAIGTL